MNALSRNAMLATMNVGNCLKSMKMQQTVWSPLWNAWKLNLLKLILHLFPTLGDEIGKSVFLLEAFTNVIETTTTSCTYPLIFVILFLPLALWVYPPSGGRTSRTPALWDKARLQVPLPCWDEVVVIPDWMKTQSNCPGVPVKTLTS